MVTDNLRGGREATQHLIDRGHRRILCIQGVRHSVPSADRVRGYRQALEDNGLSAYARVTGDGFSIRNGYEQTLRALHVRQRPTAIFALSNTILLGALKAVREMKLRIPDDISLVSFDNYDYLDYLDPAVTRVGQPSDEIGAQADGNSPATDRGRNRRGGATASAAFADRLPVGEKIISFREEKLFSA